MREKELTYSLRDLLTVVFKHRHKIIFSFIPIVVVTFFLALTVPIHYVAKSSIMIKPGREFTPSADTVASERLPAMNFEAALNTEIQILTSSDLIGKVVSAIGPFNIYPEFKRIGVSKVSAERQAIDRFLQDLLVKPMRVSTVIEVYYRHNNPQMAAKVVNTLVEHLKDKHLQVFGETKSPFIEEQLKIYEQKLSEASDKLSKFKEQNQISSIKDQYYFIVGKRTEIEGNTKLEESRLDELRKKITFLKGQKKKAISDLYTASVGAKLVDLEARETQLLGTYKDNSRPVIQIRKEIQKVKDALRQYEEELKETQEWTTLEAEIGPLELKIANLRQQMIRLDKQLAALSAGGEDLNRLERDVTVAQSNYETYLRKFEEARISEVMDKKKMTNIQVLEQAGVPVAPVKENQRKIIGVGLFLALSVSFGLAYLAEYAPQGLTTPESVIRRLQLPVLATVSYKMARR